MKIFRNILLNNYNTFGIKSTARCIIHVSTDKDAIKLMRHELYWKEPLLIVGGGSNILFTGDFNGTILHPVFGGIRIEEEHDNEVVISAGSGVIWDKLVGWAVKNNLGGIENLSLIPGMTGAVPVQNIGAYGSEVKDTIIKVKAISLNEGKIIFFNNEECSFGYRKSIFKNELKGKYLITRTWFKLKKKPAFNLEYGSLKEEVEKLGTPSLETVRQAVINIRKSKLPDPEVTGNAGSFFKNPVIDPALAEAVKSKFPDIPHYPDPSGIKIAAGWLIEKCGWKGIRIGDAGVYDSQALVLVNYGNAKGEEIYDLSEKIRQSVREKFGINLEREVQIIGAT
jgi:UDP-N-acetylmuramate dehydrogenase